MQSVLHVLLARLQSGKEHVFFLAFRCWIKNLLSYHWVQDRPIRYESAYRSTNLLIALRLFDHVSAVLLLDLTNTLLYLSDVVVLVLISWRPKLLGITRTANLTFSELNYSKL